MEQLFVCRYILYVWTGKKVRLSENWDIDLASYDLFKTKVPKHTDINLASYDLFKTKVPKHTGCDYGSTYT